MMLKIVEIGEQSDDGSEDDDGEEPQSNEKMVVMVMMKMETRSVHTLGVTVCFHCVQTFTGLQSKEQVAEKEYIKTIN